MKVKKYEEMDCGILAMLNKHPTTIWNIWLIYRDDVKGIEVIYRRMQSLRKKGLVANIPGKGWVRV
ncbi:hypothetical protein SLJ66_001968 [Escherichia coli]|nr:hypothetical protein [Escherichia coli]